MDSLGTVDVAIPLRYDTSFSWIDYPIVGIHAINKNTVSNLKTSK